MNMDALHDLESLVVEHLPPLHLARTALVNSSFRDAVALEASARMPLARALLLCPRANEPATRLLPALHVTNLQATRMLCAGSMHTIVVTSGGVVRSWGLNLSGQIGVAPDASTGMVCVGIPTTVPVPEPVAAVAAGCYHSAAISVSGQLYTWGQAGQGQLALPGSHTDTHQPTAVPGVVNAVLLTATQYETSTVSSSGEAFTWGRAGGAAGGGAVDERESKEKASSLKGTEMAAMCSGVRHAVAVTSSGDVHTWGHGMHGQLGHDSQSTAQPSARCVAALQRCRVVTVAAGGYHTMACTDVGVLYCWGWGRSGRLGLGHSEGVKIPQEVTTLGGKFVVAIAAGEHHSVAVTMDGHVWSWGEGKQGQLGHMGFENELWPRVVKGVSLW